MSLKRDLGRARYAAAQGARVAWYLSQYLLARRISGPFDRPGEPKFEPKAAEGDALRIRTAFLELFAKDRTNIEMGLYPAPDDIRLERAVAAMRHSASFFRDLPNVDQRRLERDGTEVREQAKGEGHYPTYYLQNFHYQTGGWLSQDSAKLYDTQVEILFGGAAGPAPPARRLQRGGGKPDESRTRPGKIYRCDANCCKSCSAWAGHPAGARCRPVPTGTAVALAWVQTACPWGAQQGLVT